MRKSPFNLLISAYDTQFRIHLAETRSEVDACLELRYTSVESGPISNSKDEDEFDQFCCHLMVSNLTTNQVVGTYRLLKHDVAEKNIGYYSEKVFDLTNIKQQQLKLVEVGLVCTARDYRDKNIIGMLWNGLYEYTDYFNLDYIAGCIRTPAYQDDQLTSKAYAYANQKGLLTEPSLQVTPLPTCIDKTFIPDFHISDIKSVRNELPKLLLAYFMLGSQLGGPSGYREAHNENHLYCLTPMKNRANTPRMNRFKYKSIA